jgi:hypothetical protein
MDQGSNTQERVGDVCNREKNRDKAFFAMENSPSLWAGGPLLSAYFIDGPVHHSLYQSRRKNPAQVNVVQACQWSTVVEEDQTVQQWGIQLGLEECGRQHAKGGLPSPASLKKGVNGHPVSVHHVYGSNP